VVEDRYGGSSFSVWSRLGSSAAAALGVEPAGRVVIAARKVSATNAALARAVERRGYACRVLVPERLGALGRGDLVLGRLDVCESLGGVEDGLDELAEVTATGARLLNAPTPLLLAHDKLATALILRAAGVAHPITVHVSDPTVLPLIDLPCVVKPRFGSWGRDVVRCESRADLRRALAEMAGREWFSRRGVLVQEYVPNAGTDLRAVVAGRTVVGGIERVAPRGEWRTNVALGAIRRPIELPAAAVRLALDATAALGIDLAGVDLVRDARGGLVVLEVNGAVDFTHDYLAGADVFDAAVGALLPPGPRRVSAIVPGGVRMRPAAIDLSEFDERPAALGVAAPPVP
jgi:[lysine-biosynthesis-protein LysW]--L-2-aminoadipate ligase